MLLLCCQSGQSISVDPMAQAFALPIVLMEARRTRSSVSDDRWRDMKVVAPFAYVDGDKKIWTVPAGTIVDGASISRAFWAVIGAPYTGQYREAAVVHDRYCENKERPWKDVHQAFYTRGNRGGDASPAASRRAMIS